MELSDADDSLIPAGEAPGVLDSCALGVLTMGLVGLLQLGASGDLAQLFPPATVARLSFLGRLLWIHLGVGAMVGAAVFIVCCVMRAMTGGRSSRPIANGLILGLILALPARDSLRSLLPQSRSIVIKLMLAGMVVGAAVTLLIGVSILLSRMIQWRSWPVKAVRLGAGTLAILALCCSIGAMRLPDRQPLRGGGHPDIILISLDTVRADHLETYGYGRPTSPRLNRFAADAVVFESAFAPEPWTLPSHMSMMTSLYPVVHGVRSRNARLNRRRITLAEALREVGYTSTAFVAKGPESWIGGLRGFADGFERYHHPPHEKVEAAGTTLLTLMSVLSRRKPGTAEDVTAGALHFLALRPAQPFFLFLHYYDAHSDFTRLPYEAPGHLIDLFASPPAGGFDGCDAEGHCASDFLGRFSRCSDRTVEPEVLDSIVAHYDAGIRYVDGYLGMLFDALRESDLYDSSLIIVTADHGEEFLEHGRFLHSQLYRETMHVPLLVKLPGQQHAGTRITDPAELIDLMPTVLELIGAPPVEQMQGRSLLRHLTEDGPTEEGPVERNLYLSNTEQGGEFRTRQISIQTSGEKLIVPLIDECLERGRDADFYYYDLKNDPEERSNLAPVLSPGGGDDLQTLLFRWYQESQDLYERSSVASEERIEISEEEIERLKALGYIGD